MLESLHISNYALIDKVDIRFHEGLNIITGETGAGKSIMLGALSLLLGARADTRMVRRREAKSVIEAIFTVGTADPSLKDYCLEADIEWDESRCILRREISPAGRSRAFINDSPVPLTKLQDVAMRLVDIHSQHNNQLLTQPDYQLKVLDTLAVNGSQRQVFATRFHALREALKRLKATRLKIQQARDDEEYTRFQLEQLDELNLVAGEQEELEREREVMANLTDLKSDLTDALDSLSEGSTNILELMGELRESIDRLSPIISEEDDIPARLENVRLELKDISETLEAADSQLQADPRDLDRIEQRLNDIYSLERKHHVETVTELINLREDLRRRLEVLTESDITITELEKDARRAMALAREAAKALTDSRMAAAGWLGEEITLRATPLGMKNLRCEIQIEPTEMSATGSDKVTFSFAFNKNQPLMPVGGAASGGEISRLMLTLKTILADKISLPSIIFDEVDTGVSGDVASRMGLMMADISNSIQVIAITHLPQVAAKGAAHYKVYKEDDDHATYTHIIELNEASRVKELALMLSGSTTDEAALAAARSLLSQHK